MSIDVQGRGASAVWDQKYRRDIQGLRALAVIAVVCFHAGLPVSGGFVGVDIFFVISGFVITLMLEREWRGKGKLDLKTFYLRRFKRLMPALALLVSVTMLAGLFLLSPMGTQVKVSGQTGISAVLMAANIVIAKNTGGYFDAAASDNPLLNIWSLSVEEQFYLFFPSLLIIGFALSRRSKWRMAPLLLVSLAGIVSLFAALVGCFATGLRPNVQLLLGFYSPLSRAWEFAAGALLVLARTAAPKTSWQNAALVASGLAAMFLSFFVISGSTPFPGPMTLLPVLGAVAVILAGTGVEAVTPLSRALGSRPLVFVGDISYSWYLWHWPVIVLAARAFGQTIFVTISAAVLSLIPAIVSYRWLESPLRKLAVAGPRQVIAFIGAVLLPPILVCLLFLFVHSNNVWSERVKFFKDAVNSPHAANVAGCADGFVPGSSKDQTCTWNRDAGGLPIYLVGDSNAGHLSEAVIDAGKKMGSPVTILSKGGCSFIGRSWSNQNDKVQLECQAFMDGARHFITQAKPGIVVFGLSDSIWWLDGIAAGPTRLTQSISIPVMERYLKGDLTDAVSSFQRAGQKTLLVLPIPKFTVNASHFLFDPARCSTLSVMQGRCPENVTVSIKFEDGLQRDARRTIAEVARETGSPLVDLRSQFCTREGCSPMTPDGKILYHDAGHLTVNASKSLSPLFYAALMKLSRS